MKIYAMVPIFASAKFECEKPDNWDEMSLEEKKDHFLSNAENLGTSVCHQCSDSVQMDGCVDDKTYDKWFSEEDFWEE